MTIAPVPLSSASLVKASFSSLKSGLDNALSALGLFSVTLKIVSAPSTKETSLIEPSHTAFGTDIPKPTPDLGLETMICSYDERREAEAAYPLEKLGKDEA